MHLTLLRILVALNVMDTASTSMVVGLKWAVEANPIMDVFVQQGPAVFAMAKLSLTFAGALLLWKARRSVWSKRAAAALVLVYTGVIVYQLGMIGATLFLEMR